MTKKPEIAAVELLNKINIPFTGTVIQDLTGKNKTNKFFISPFINISISGIGPVFYIDQKTSKIYTLLQRRFKDNFQWWFPGGYVELIPFGAEKLILENGKKIKLPAFKKLKEAVVDEYYKNIIKYGSWQKAKKEINDPEFLTNLFKKHQIKWPKEIDSNWQDAWKREVLEEMGIDIKKYKKAIILDFKNNSTLMIGAERDRLTNIDGKFAALLGVLNKQPKTSPDDEVEEARWIDIEEIFYDKKKKKFLSHGFELNLYTQSLIEEALFEFLCYKIKRISKIQNSFSKQQISRFNTPQNIQTYLLEKTKNKNLRQNLDKLIYLKSFLSWQFGELEIGVNLYGKQGWNLYKTTIAICIYLSQNCFDHIDFADLNHFIKKQINNLNYFHEFL